MTRHFIFLALFAVILGIVIIPGAYARQAPQMPQTYSLYQVLPGEGYDSVADKFLPQVPYDTAKRWIETVNHKPDSYELQRGETILVPDEYGPYPLRLVEEEQERQVAQDALQRATVHAASRGGDGVQRRYKQLTMTATAYSAGHTTFSGLPVDKGSIAVDPRVIPLDTRLWVEGYGYGQAQDTGRLIKGNKIDVYLPSEVEALEWGVRRVRVRVISQ